jgi:hypothetical protein
VHALHLPAIVRVATKPIRGRRFPREAKDE